MRPVVASMFVSLDGVVQAPGGPQEDEAGGFQFGGWTVPHFDEVVGQCLGELFEQDFDLLLGRRTYDIFAAHWPVVGAMAEGSGIDPGEMAIARKFNAATKYVASHTRTSLDWENSRVLTGNAAERVRDLAEGEGPMLLLQGSSEFAHALLAEGLIDELRLVTFPVVLGRGKRLFDGNARPSEFTLAKAVPAPSGVIVATYRRTGPIRTGSFAL